MEDSISCLVISHREKISSMKRFHSKGFLELRLVIFVFAISAMKTLANATAILVSIPVPCVCKLFFQLNWKEFSCSINFRISVRPVLG